MNTIRQIHLHLLRNGAHLTYMRQVLEAAAAALQDFRSGAPPHIHECKEASRPLPAVTQR